MPVEDSLRRHGVHRVVEVRVPGRVSSGYAVAADLVLTTRHGLRDADAPNPDHARIRPLAGDPTDATVVWRGSSDVDAALLRVPSAPWRDDPGVAWTRWAAPEGDGVPVVARGFPRAKAAEGLRDLETMRGTVDHATGLVAGRHSVDIATPELLSGEEGYWRGMSGAVALAEPALQVIGVVAFDPLAYRGRRLEVVPAAELLRDEAFAELVGAGEGALERAARTDVTTVDTVLQQPSVPLPAEHSDWQLLLPRYAVVPFQGREESRAALLDWCRGPRAFDLAVITGEGGAGKTRLAAQVCAEIAAEGWDTGLIAESALRPEPEVLRPTLAVVDYAEPHAEAVGAFVRAMNGRGHGPPVRLLLVARSDVREGRWWRDLNARSEGVAAYLRPPVASLNATPLSIEEREAHATAALTAFGAPDGRALPHLDKPEYAHPMRLHMAALLTARNEAPGTRDSVLGQFLAREERLWLGSWSPDPGDEDRILTGQAVALIALASPLRSDAGDVLAALPDVDGRTIRRLTRWLDTVFPGDERRLVFGPDILTEELLNGTEDLHLLLHTLIGDAADRARLARILDTALLAGGSARVRASLTYALAEHLPRVAELALSDDKGTLVPALDACLRLLMRDPALRRPLNAACAEVPEGVGDPFRHWRLRSTIAGGTVDRAKEVSDPARFAWTGGDLAVYWLQDGRTDAAAWVVDDALLTGLPVPVLHTAAAVVSFVQARPEDAADHIGAAVRLNARPDGQRAAALMNQAVVRSWRKDVRGAARSLKEASGIVGENELVDALDAFTVHFPPWEPAGADATPSGFLLHDRFGTPPDLPEELRKAAVRLARQVVAALDTVETDPAAAEALNHMGLVLSVDDDTALDAGLFEAMLAYARRTEDLFLTVSPGLVLLGARVGAMDFEGVLREVAWLEQLLLPMRYPPLIAEMFLDKAEALSGLGRDTEAVAALDRAEEHAGDDPDRLARIRQARGEAATALGDLDVSLAHAEAEVAKARTDLADYPDAAQDLLLGLVDVHAARRALGLDTGDVAAEIRPLWREWRDDLSPELALMTGMMMRADELLDGPEAEEELEWLFERARSRSADSLLPPRFRAEVFVAAGVGLMMLRVVDGRPFDPELVGEIRRTIVRELDGHPVHLTRLHVALSIVEKHAENGAARLRELRNGVEAVAQVADPLRAAELLTLLGASFTDVDEPDTARSLLVRALDLVGDVPESPDRATVVARVREKLAAIDDPTPDQPD